MAFNGATGFGIIGGAGTATTTYEGSSPMQIDPYVYSSITAGTFGIVASDSDYTNGAYSNQAADASGDRINYSIETIPGGVYSFVVCVRYGPNCGILKTYFEGTLIDTTDTYAVGATYNNKITITGITATGGISTLYFLTNSKNAGSGGYEMYLESITVIQTA